MSNTTIRINLLGRNGFETIIREVAITVREVCEEQGIDFETARVNGNPASTSQILNENDVITSVPAKEVTGNS